VLLGLALAVAAMAVVFALLNPYALLNLDEARDQITSQSSQADTAKLGQDDTYGWLYYLGTLTWGFGWLPLVAAVAGAVLAIRRDWRLALLLVVFPVCFYLYMGAQGRFFGRWLLPIYPALCVLAGYAVATLSARRVAVLAGLTALLCAQGALAAVHIDRLLGREDTRAQALAWVHANVPAGAPVVVEPFVPDSWRAALDRPIWPVERPYQAYEKRLRVRHIDRYRERGHCWVIVGSTQKQRGLEAGLTSSRNYYRALDDASAETVTFSPFARDADAVGFSYDSSFNYRPRAYERPGPVVEIHRLRDCTPAVG
jgi:4-amino-4-deoxy-L-arabinose transferase-like glycosyltransferase